MITQSLLATIQASLLTKMTANLKLSSIYDNSVLVNHITGQARENPIARLPGVAREGVRATPKKNGVARGNSESQRFFLAWNYIFQLSK